MDNEPFPIQHSFTEATSSVTGATGDDDNHGGTGRKTCTKCERPITVCLCSTLPDKPIQTVTRVVILHHPLEQRHRLTTVPVLAKCLGNCNVIVGRKLRYGDSDILDSLHDHAIRNPNSPVCALYLFPGTKTSPSIELNQWKISDSNFEVENCVLIAFDGTWKHAKEMLEASSPFLSRFAVQVCLNYEVGVEGGTIFDSELTLRKEPCGGCMSTMEAISRCLQILEPNGSEVEARLIKVLQDMVRFQARYLKPMKPRPKLVKMVKGQRAVNDCKLVVG